MSAFERLELFGGNNINNGLPLHVDHSAEQKKIHSHINWSSYAWVKNRGFPFQSVLRMVQTLQKHYYVHHLEAAKVT